MRFVLFSCNSEARLGLVLAGNPARVIKYIADLECPYDLIDRPWGI